MYALRSVPDTSTISAGSMSIRLQRVRLFSNSSQTGLSKCTGMQGADTRARQLQLTKRRCLWGEDRGGTGDGRQEIVKPHT